MQITYQASTADHLRCFGKSVAQKPALLVQLLAAPLFLSFVNAYVLGSGGNRLLRFIGIFVFITVFFVLALVWQCAQRSKRSCTTTIWYDGIHDVAPEKAGFIPWVNVRSIVNSDGDVFVSGATAASGLYIARSAWPPQLPASTFVECAQRAQRGDFSMIVPPPQPAYPAPQYAPQQPNVWPPPPGQG